MQNEKIQNLGREVKRYGQQNEKSKIHLVTVSKGMKKKKKTIGE